MLETFVLDTTHDDSVDAIEYFEHVLKKCTQNLTIAHAVTTDQTPASKCKHLTKSQLLLTFEDFDQAKDCITSNWQQEFVVQHAPEIKSQDPILKINKSNSTLEYPIDDSIDQLERYIFAWKQELAILANTDIKKLQKLVQKWISSMDANHMTGLSLGNCDFLLSDMKVGRHKMIKDWFISSSQKEIVDVWMAMATRLLEASKIFIITTQDTLNKKNLADKVLYRKSFFQIPLNELPLQSEELLDIDCMAEGTLRSDSETQFILIMRKNEHQEYEYRLILSTEDESKNLEHYLQKLI